MKRHIIVTSNTGAAVPGMGRLGKGTHKDVELTVEQVSALKSNPDAEVLTTTEFNKRKA